VGLMLLRDATCPACGRTGEILGDEVCPCGVSMVAHAISFHPTQPLDPRMATVMSKSSQIRKRLQGKLPWRKSSESQSD
jgi:hypothetical protein